MPDPHKALAPIIEPTPPPSLPQTASDWPDIALVGAIFLLCLGLAFWLWRRHAPMRALYRIARHSDAHAGAAQLANWVRTQQIQPTENWQAALEHLRFAAPTADAATQLASLCREIAQHSRTAEKQRK